MFEVDTAEVHYALQERNKAANILARPYLQNYSAIEYRMSIWFKAWGS
jgi:hypothetical protein